MSTTEVSQVTYGIDSAGHIHEIIDGVARRMGVGKHPLASDGMKLICLFIEWGQRWDALTKAQQRCVLDPTTRTTRPWKALQDKGYAANDALTEAGRFLVAMHQRSAGAS